jgi:hypothetical protein
MDEIKLFQQSASTLPPRQQSQAKAGGPSAMGSSGPPSLSAKGSLAASICRGQDDAVPRQTRMSDHIVHATKTALLFLLP